MPLSPLSLALIRANAISPPDHPPQKYTGWSLADGDFTDNVDPRKARIVFYIMMAGHQDLAGLDILFRTLYHVDHFFLVHLDVKVHVIFAMYAREPYRQKDISSS